MLTVHNLYGTQGKLLPPLSDMRRVKFPSLCKGPSTHRSLWSPPSWWWPRCPWFIKIFGSIAGCGGDGGRRVGKALQILRPLAALLLHAVENIGLTAPLSLSNRAISSYFDESDSHFFVEG